ncbi:MAG: UbiA prenyltransferase family protein [Bacteroidota bacterium]
MTSIQAIMTLVRVKHWVKNIFVFLPAFFALRVDYLLTPSLYLLFISFCLVASSVYLFNDLMDLEADRQHPQNRYRPLASGQIPPNQAKIGLFGLLLLALLSFYWIPNAWPFLLAYLILNIAYSLVLKKIPLVNVSCIALGFLLRIYAGGAVVEIPISQWMIVVVFLLTLSIALAKKRSNILLLGIDSSPMLDLYNSSMLIGFSATFAAYVFYCLDEATIARMQSPSLYLTALFVFFGILRYLQLIFVQQKMEDPTTLFWTDRPMQIILFFWITTFAYLIYG